MQLTLQIAALSQWTRYWLANRCIVTLSFLCNYNYVNSKTLDATKAALMVMALCRNIYWLTNTCVVTMSFLCKYIWMHIKKNTWHNKKPPFPSHGFIKKKITRQYFLTYKEMCYKRKSNPHPFTHEVRVRLLRWTIWRWFNQWTA